jgi:glycosyltransferase involved in cell wall biosynthesis
MTAMTMHMVTPVVRLPRRRPSVQVGGRDCRRPAAAATLLQGSGGHAFRLMVKQGEPQGRHARRIAVCLPDMGGGGAERVALEIIRDLLAAGHEVDLVLVRATGELMPLVPPQVRVIDLHASRVLAALRPLTRYFRRERPDAIQVSLWPLTTVAIVARWLAGSKARLMTSDHIAFAQASWWDTLPIRLTAGPLYLLADVRVSVSEGAARDLAEVTGMRRDRFEVIYNPISPPEDIRSNKEADRLWGSAKIRILAVGSLKPQKNHALVIRAFARMTPDAKLMILGEGPLRGELEALAAELGIADNVTMPGFALDPWPYYASASLFVLSSDYEGFANVVLEALAAGLPVVSTDCRSGPAEILDHGRFGALVSVGDEAALAEAIERTLQEPHDPEAGKERAAHFSAGSARRYRQLLVPGDDDLVSR